MQALDSLEFCLESATQLYGEKHYELGRIYNSIGIVYRNTGLYAQALSNFRKAEENYLLDEGATDRLIMVFRNIGNVHLSKLDFSEALRYYNYALDKQIENSPIRKDLIAEAYLKIALVNYQLRNYSEAIEIAKSNIEHASLGDKIDYISYMAYSYQELRDNENAKTSYKQLIDLSIEEFQNHPYVAEIYLNYAYFLIEIEEFEPARHQLDKAFNIIEFNQLTRGFEIARFYELEAELIRNIPVESRTKSLFNKSKRRNLVSAIDLYRKALAALNFHSNVDMSAIEEAEQWTSLIDCISLLKEYSDSYMELSQLKDQSNDTPLTIRAIDGYELISNLIQKARKEFTDDESKILLTELEQSTFHKLIEASYQAYTSTNDFRYFEFAFNSAERTKSSSVFDKLSMEFAMENSLIPDSLVQKESELNTTISNLSEELHQKESSEVIDTARVREIKTAIFKKNRERDSLYQFMEVNYPDFYQMKYSPSKLTVKNIQERLETDEIILEYVYAPEEERIILYCFLISNEKVKFHKQYLELEFDRSLDEVFHFMSDPEYFNTTQVESKNYCKQAHYLYSNLVEPHKETVANRRLLIIPDGKLNYLAFEGLISELPDITQNIQFNKLAYLIKDYNINYSNSANILFSDRKANRKRKNEVLAFAPEYNQDSVTFSNRDYVLFALPGVQKEVDLIADEVETTVFRGREASESNFRKNIEEYDILHLAMHAFINDSLPAFSSFAFSQEGLNKDSLTLKDDGWLKTSDIYNLKLNSRLAVLSACNTGGGRLQTGEGLMSLARGFFYAGCPSLVMSLWEVEDQSGTAIMSAFYKNLKRGKTKDEALRQAKLEYLKNSNSRRAHPHYWLGYISMGDNSPVYKSYDYYFFAILLVIVLLVIMDQLIRLNKAKRTRQK